MDENLDTVLEKCLAVCDARSPHDAIAVALHACLLADGFVCIATGDEVGALHLEYSICKDVYSYTCIVNSAARVKLRRLYRVTRMAIL